MELKLDVADIKPLMVFQAVDLVSLLFVVDRVDLAQNMAHGRSWGCFGGEQQDAIELSLLLDPTKFQLNLRDSFGAMSAKMAYLEEQREKHECEMDKAVAGSFMLRTGAENAALKTRVEELEKQLKAQQANPTDKLVSWFATHTTTTEGPTSPNQPAPNAPRKDALSELSCVLWFLSQLTCDHLPGCAIKEAVPETCNCEKLIPDDDPWYKRARNALVLVGDLMREQTRRTILTCNNPGCGASLRAGEHLVCAPCAEKLPKMEVVYEGVLDQMRASKRSRPEPHEYVETDPYKGCAVCGIGPGAFHHNSAEVRRFNEAKASGDQLAAYRTGGEHHTDDSWRTGRPSNAEQAAAADKKAEPLHGKVLQLKPLPGYPGPKGDGSVYEVALPDKVVKLLVLRVERGSMSPEQVEQMRKTYSKLFEGTVGFAIIAPGDELTLLEIP